MPEVSLVAIMDADKEGFLRSEQSLIQTIGRAARNLNGRAILYADKITGSMQRAMDETERRRSKQLAFNKTHGIKPVGIQKPVADIMESAVVVGRGKKVAEKRKRYQVDVDTAGMDKWKQIEVLEKKMYQCAKDLEFEQAAQIRDQIEQLRTSG